MSAYRNSHLPKSPFPEMSADQNVLYDYVDLGPYAWSTNSDVNGTIALTYR